MSRTLTRQCGRCRPLPDQTELVQQLRFLLYVKNEEEDRWWRRTFAAFGKKIDRCSICWPRRSEAIRAAFFDRRLVDSRGDDAYTAPRECVSANGQVFPAQHPVIPGRAYLQCRHEWCRRWFLGPRVAVELGPVALAFAVIAASVAPYPPICAYCDGARREILQKIDDELAPRQIAVASV